MQAHGDSRASRAGAPAPLCSPRAGPPPLPGSPAPYGRAPPYGRASGRAVAGKPAFFFIGYARRSGRQVLHSGIRQTVLCSRWSRTDRRTPTLRTRRLSDRPLRVLSDVGGCGFSDCDVVGAVALLWSNNLKLSANHRHLTQSTEIEYTDGRERKKRADGLTPISPIRGLRPQKRSRADAR